jgi:acetyl esterase/lipase
VFAEETIPKSALELNEAIIARLTGKADMWTESAEQLRAARARGEGSYPLCPPDPAAETFEIPASGRTIPVRIIRPESRTERGTYLHIHGGGWIMGAPQESDERLRRLAENTGLTLISIDYRLAPEHPYPAAPDDCEAVALWLLEASNSKNNLSFLAIGGESAGAHLSAVTLSRLRDRHGITPFHAANLVAGCYDLGCTPSVRNWGDSRLILRTVDMEYFCGQFLQNYENTRDPDISPLYANLAGLPPALFSCGTKDLLIDDTLFMAMRWAAAGICTETGIFPGGCHVFQAFGTDQAETSLSQMDDFLNRRIAEVCK